MKNQKLSKLDIAIKACQDTLECIKKQQEFNKLKSPKDETSEDKWLTDAYIEEKIIGEDIPDTDDGEESEDR